MSPRKAPSNPPGADEALVTASQIAVIYGLPPSTLANHRTRNEDFPQPVARDGRTLSYRLSEIREYAEKQNWREAGPARALPLAIDDLPNTATAALAAEGAVRATGLSTSSAALVDWTEAMSMLAEPWASLIARSGIQKALTDLTESPEGYQEELTQAQAEGDVGRALDDIISRVSRDTSGRQLPSATSPALAAWVQAAASPAAGVVADPACGLGLLLVTVASGEAAAPERIVGIDEDADALRICALRSLAHGLPVELIHGDSLSQDGPTRNLHGTCDLVVLDAPSGAYSDSFINTRGRQKGRDPRKTATTFGSPPVTEQAFRWMATCYDLLGDHGRAVVVTPARTLDATGRAAAFRAAAAHVGAVGAVITLPNGLRPGSAPELALWVLEKNPKPGPRPILTVAGNLLAAQFGDNAAPQILNQILRALLPHRAAGTTTPLAKWALPPDVDPVAVRLILPEDQDGDCVLTPWSPRARPVDSLPNAPERTTTTQPSIRTTPDTPDPRLDATVQQIGELQAHLARLQHLLTEAPDRRRRTDAVSLSDLLHSGQVVAYEREHSHDPRSALRLVDEDEARFKSSRRRISIETETTSRQGDIVVAIGRRSGADEVEATIFPTLPRGFDLNSRTLVYLRVVEETDAVSPQAICDAINMLAARTWPASSRGPLNLARAAAFVKVPADAWGQFAMRAALEARTAAQHLAATLSYRDSWS